MNFTKQRVLRGIRLRLCSKIYFDSNDDIGNSILICGSGRSGTTWLGEVVNSGNKFRTIFEPFHPHRVRTWMDYPHRCYLPVGNTDQSVFRDVSRILSGQIRDKWSATHNTKLFSSQRIIKEISMNNSLPYLKKKFPKLKMIFLHRNPFDVARSRIKLGWHKESDPTVITDLSVFVKQPLLMNDFLHPFQGIFEDGTLTDIEREIAFWCGENYIPLNHMQEDDMFITVSYDSLIAWPLREYTRIFEFLNLKTPIDLINRVDIPSTTSSDVRDKDRGICQKTAPSDRSYWILQQFNLTKFAF
jgi:hypothetical protein